MKERDYVMAARVIGVQDSRILFRHIIPNAIFPTLVLASLGIGDVVLAFAALSFLGIGTDIGYADWGQVLSFARNWITSLNIYWYIIVYPGITLVLFVMGWNLLGDALRDVLDRGCAARSKCFVQKKTLLKFIVLPLGIALLIAGLFFDGGIADTVRVQADATPTADRLAEPTLPAAPSQADHGAQVYWLSCMPCHGDQGQGLTDEFRATYPPEEEYCWESGCHGANPYESGFTIPKEDSCCDRRDHPGKIFRCGATQCLHPGNDAVLETRESHGRGVLARDGLHPAAERSVECFD